MAAAMLVFAVYAADLDAVARAAVLAESLRVFGGSSSRSTVLVYVPPELLGAESTIVAELAEAGAEARTVAAPPVAGRWPYGAKVFAAAHAERDVADAGGRDVLLVWMDDDTVVLQDPAEFRLPDGVLLGWRPVLHNRIGPRWGTPPDELWSRIYGIAGVADSALFPMRTVADRVELAPHFNAGLLAVRPDAGILRRWAEVFEAAAVDSAVAAACAGDRLRTIFLHQAALAGAVLSRVPRERMIELPPVYNYPLLFRRVFGGDDQFASLDGVVTLRYESWLVHPDSRWPEEVTGPREVLDWLRSRLGSLHP